LVSDPLIARFGWKEGGGDVPEFAVRACEWHGEARVADERRVWVSLELDGRTGTVKGWGET
jgi:hypothetical protein